MLNRQRIVLGMLAESGGCLNKLDLVKLLFLLNEEEESLPRSAVLEFLPYHRGPYSFTLAHDLKNLEMAGMVRQTARYVTITSEGAAESAITPPELSRGVKRCHRRHGSKTTDGLVDHVYDTYAWYTINSKWIDRRAQIRPVAEIAIYTTGYEGVQLDGLLNRLMRAGVRRLIDVRANPVARRFGFHRSTLDRVCAKVDIEYVHLPEVGIPGEWRTELSTRSDYQALFDRYESDVLPAQGDALRRLSRLIVDRPSAMMCKEADPDSCHRTTLAHYLAKTLELPVIDLRTEVTGALF
ncbi:MAG: DUF488 domain-containing protein [Armatimonadetes bacterium]|nr:DUF488 domain-containing protein [Armatimonadota bacterium]